jgi:hypothetical protein
MRINVDTDATVIDVQPSTINGASEIQCRTITEMRESLDLPEIAGRYYSEQLRDFKAKLISQRTAKAIVAAL